MKQLNILIYRSLAVFTSIILLSGSGLSSVEQKQVKVAQSTTEKQAAERLLREGFNLLEQETLNSQTQAVKKFKQGLALSQKLGDKGQEYQYYAALGISYSKLEEEQKALSNFNQALSILMNEFKGIEATRIQLMIKGLISATYSQFGKHQKALSILQTMIISHNTSGGLTGLGSIYHTIGKVHSKLGDKQEALSYYDKALTSLRAEGNRAAEKRILDNPYRSFTQLVSLPKRLTKNNGLTSPSAEYMVSVLGSPGVIDDKSGCKTVSPSFDKMFVTEEVGPFKDKKLRGLKPFLKAVGEVLATVKKENPKLYSILGHDGGICVRAKNIQGHYTPGKNGTNYSNHSFGTAIDIHFKSSEAECEDQWFKQKDELGLCKDNLKDTKALAGFLELYPYFHKAKFYWGGTFSKNPDAMHFEASQELIEQWKKSGEIPPLVSK